jgi:hypothetical protein
VVRAKDGALYYAPSAWHDASGAVIPPPPALAYATAYGGGIVTPEGEIEPTGRAVKTPPSTRTTAPSGPVP